MTKLKTIISNLELFIDFYDNKSRGLIASAQNGVQLIDVLREAVAELKKLKAPKERYGKTQIVNCKQCQTTFSARTADIRRGWGKYCSKSCKAMSQAQRGNDKLNYGTDSFDVEDSFHPHDSYSLGQE
jgi:hypothetical protein